MPSDPLHQLRQPASPARPNPQFAIALWRRIEEELGMTISDTDALTTGQLGIVHLRVADADRAYAFFHGLLDWQSEPFREGFTAHYIVNTRRLTVLTDDPDAPPVRLFFPMNDVARGVELVTELGGRVDNQEVAADGGGWARVRDSQGIPLGLWRPN